MAYVFTPVNVTDLYDILRITDRGAEETSSLATDTDAPVMDSLASLLP